MTRATGVGKGNGEGSRATQVKPGEVRNPRGGVAREESDGLTDAGRMRRVFEQGRQADCNSAQRRLRKLFDKDVKSYMVLMTQLERQERLGQAGPGGSVGNGADPGLVGRGGPEGPGPAGLPPAGEGELRVLRLCEELLARASGGPPRSG